MMIFEREVSEYEMQELKKKGLEELKQWTDQINDAKIKDF